MNPRRRVMPWFVALVFSAALALAFAPGHSAAAAPAREVTPIPSMSPDDLLAAIRNRFRSHRPPPPYEVYVITRKQETNYGYPDYANSYTDHVWYRSYDHAALERRETELGDIGQMRFERPVFNQATDPGPPTADVFEPAPLHTPPADFVPTPEASMPPVIVTVKARGEFDYRVTSVTHEGDELHLKLQPRRQPDRNRLRELWVDAKTLDLRKLVATDKLFVEKGPIYPVLFTVTFKMYETIPVITHIHGVVYGGYDGDGQVVDYDFTDLKFPLHLPDWYFNPRDYAQHVNDAPE
ncbi:MAG TPA: hypothetical protein VFN49_10295 [Candidatus Aquilonibacter sp.]|nr:hypothetical protein [Candidatus Aquilonibacter sp.]